MCLGMAKWGVQRRRNNEGPESSAQEQVLLWKTFMLPPGRGLCVCGAPQPCTPSLAQHLEGAHSRLGGVLGEWMLPSWCPQCAMMFRSNARLSSWLSIYPSFL